jgi:hypothetical protein
VAAQRAGRDFAETGMRMAEDGEATKRIVAAPSAGASPRAGDVLSVEVGPDEDVEWVWSHDRLGGSRVTGYVIVPRDDPRDL